jgi:beta-xylosidase
VLERPKVIYNKTTKQFVMWMHIDTADYKMARTGVAVSATPAGPFKYLGSFRPNAGIWPSNISEKEKSPGVPNPLARDFKNGQMARDLTLFVDDDEMAYLFYSSEENATMHIAALREDYLRPSGKYARVFVGRSMEAPAVFKHARKYYLIASGCTAWAPNAVRIAVADSIFGPWTELGNPCTGEGSEITFGSQSTFVLPNPQRKGQFIFMADRWNQWDLAASRQVWLPLEFDPEGKPAVRWHDRWSLIDYASQLQAQRVDEVPKKPKSVGKF